MTVLRRLYQFLHSEFNLSIFHGIMFFFFFEMIGEVNSSSSLLSFVYSPASTSSMPGYITLLFFPILGPIVPAFLGLFQKFRERKIAQIIMVMICACIVLISRIIAAFLRNPGRGFLACISCTAFMAYFPFVLQHGGLVVSKSNEHESLQVGTGLAIGILLNILFRTAGSSVDVLLYPVSAAYIVTFLMALYVLVMLVLLLFYHIFDEYSLQNNQEPETQDSRRIAISSALYDPAKYKTGFRKATAAIQACGLMNILTLLYFTSANPFVVTRWVDMNFFTTNLIDLIATYVYIFIAVARVCLDVFPRLRPIVILILNCVYIVFLTLCVYLSQNGYANDTNVLFSSMLLFGCLVLTPLVLLDFQLLWYDIVRGKGHLTLICFGFAFGWALFSAWNLFASFTLVYSDFAPGARDKAWVVMLLVALCAFVPVLFVRGNAYLYGHGEFNVYNMFLQFYRVYFLGKKRDAVEYNYDANMLNRTKRVVAETGIEESSSCNTFHYILVLVFSFVVLILAIILMFGLRAKTPDTDSTFPRNITAVVYNIQSGIDQQSNRYYVELFNLLKNSQADIIGLIESDTARSVFSNDDVVRYLNEKFNYFNYYGPFPTSGTYGVCLLSKYPFVSFETKMLPAVGSQTALVVADVVISQLDWRVIVALTNEKDADTITTVNAIKTASDNTARTIVLGSFLFNETSELYSNLTNKLNDTYISALNNAGLSISDYPGYTFPSQFPSIRLDYIFATADLKVLNSTILNSVPVADHFAVKTIFANPQTPPA